MKIDIQLIEWDRSNRKKVRIGPSFASTAEDAAVVPMSTVVSLEMGKHLC